MERRSRKKSVTVTKDTIKKYTYFWAIPLVVLVLILVIVAVDRGNKDKENPAESESPAAETTIPAAGGESLEEDGLVKETEETFDLSGYVLKQDEIPELTALVQEYCQAKADGDPARLLAVFGKTQASEAELSEEQAKMDKVRQMVEGYENITCYFVDGLEPATYVIYPYFEIRYKDASMVMPSLTWSYVKRDGDGKFYMTQNVTDEEAEFIANVSLLDSVKSLSAQVEAQRNQAFEMDEVLRSIYQMMETEPVGSDTSDETGEMPVETAGEPETTAGSESKAGETAAETQAAS